MMMLPATASVPVVNTGGTSSATGLTTTTTVAAAAAAARKASSGKSVQSKVSIIPYEEPGDYGLLDVQSKRILRASELVMQIDQLQQKLHHEFGVEVVLMANEPTQWRFSDGSSNVLHAGLALPASFKLKRREHEQIMATLGSSSNGNDVLVGIKRRQSVKSGQKRKKTAASSTSEANTAEETEAALLHDAITGNDLEAPAPAAATDAPPEHAVLPDVVDAPSSTGKVRAKYERSDNFNFSTFFQVACLYKVLNQGSLNVSNGWKVPREAPWPEAAWGMNFYNRMLSVRVGDIIITSEEKQKLDSIGFVWDRHDYKFDAFIQALQLYKELHGGSMSVPKGWRVPAETPWPRGAWNVNLHEKISHLRRGPSQVSIEEREKLDNVGFVWNPMGDKSKIVMAAFVAFKRKYGHLDVLQKFVVPCSEDFPEETWGLKLGLRVKDIRQNGYFKHLHKELEELGFSFTKKEAAYSK